jgi:hypothetical protein
MNADRNNIELCGRLVRDIKLCEKKSGATYGIITILTRRDKGDKGEFFEVFIWNNKIIDCYGQYLKTGKRVSIKGWLSRTKENFYINLTEDYGLIIAMDIKDLKKDKEGSLAWIAALEEENEIYEKKLKVYEGKYNEEKSECSSEAESESKN